MIEVNRTDPSESNYALVIISVENIESGRISELNTRISDAMKWAINWYNDSIIVAYNSDLGTKAWIYNDLDFTETEPNEDLIQFGYALKRNKYQ